MELAGLGAPALAAPAHPLSDRVARARMLASTNRLLSFMPAISACFSAGANGPCLDEAKRQLNGWGTESLSLQFDLARSRLHGCTRRLTKEYVGLGTPLTRVATALRTQSPSGALLAERAVTRAKAVRRELRTCS